MLDKSRMHDFAAQQAFYLPLMTHHWRAREASRFAGRRKRGAAIFRRILCHAGNDGGRRGRAVDRRGGGRHQPSDLAPWRRPFKKAGDFKEKRRHWARSSNFPQTRT